MQHPALDPLEAWRYVGTSARTRIREGGWPRYCIVRVITWQPPFFTLCRGQRTVRAEELLLAVRPESICRECLQEAIRRGDFPLRRELAPLYHYHQQTKGVTT